jgi:hypothetical protein
VRDYIAASRGILCGKGHRSAQFTPRCGVVAARSGFCEHRRQVHEALAAARKPAGQEVATNGMTDPSRRRVRERRGRSHPARPWTRRRQRSIAWPRASGSRRPELSSGNAGAGSEKSTGATRTALTTTDGTCDAAPIAEEQLIWPGGFRPDTVCLDACPRHGDGAS